MDGCTACMEVRGDELVVAELATAGPHHMGEKKGEK